MKISIEIQTEALGPNRYGVIGLRPDKTKYFGFHGLWSSSAAEKKAEDYLQKINPNVSIRWEPQPGVEEVGEVLYRGFALVPGEAAEAEENSK
jgi:hypothetical protein